MIAGIGIDSTKVERIAKSMEKETFVKKVFGKQEQEFLSTRKGSLKAESAAANFAVKEAFLKAVGTGLGGFALHEIETLRQSSGQPYLVFSGTTQDYILEKNLIVHVSITHEDGVATAFVIIEKQPEK